MPPDGPTEPSAGPHPTPPPTPPPHSTPPPPPPMGGETVVAGTASGGGGGTTQIAITDIARLPMPGNAEFALYAFLMIIFTLLWWFDDSIGSYTWMVITTALTFGYFISRGIAKASRVLEQ